MLPLYVGMCEISIDVATKDLNHLKNSQLHPQQLDSNLIHRDLNMYATKTGISVYPALRSTIITRFIANRGLKSRWPETYAKQ